ncbi:MAG: hypothetical protein GOVbin2917_132 [Prokaryotic dsDNA virus sp.]|jgi:hypothetical protein|nr:MAG: hypothetical protein GOVbin2917_132 [Prokaryotic dsDNA virus sp.]
MDIAKQIILNSTHIDDIKFKAGILSNEEYISDAGSWYYFPDQSFIQIVDGEVSLGDC